MEIVHAPLLTTRLCRWRSCRLRKREKYRWNSVTFLQLPPQMSARRAQKSEFPTRTRLRCTSSGTLPRHSVFVRYAAAIWVGFPMKNAVAAPRPTIADTSISAENFSHRQLIPKLQAFSQSIQETSMLRFYSSVYSDDKMLIRKMSGDSAFHGTPPPNRCRTSNKPNTSATFPTCSSLT